MDADNRRANASSMQLEHSICIRRPSLEELGFGKGDILAVLRHQDDGWWEAEVHGGNGRVGLVPSDYLQPC